MTGTRHGPNTDGRFLTNGPALLRSETRKKPGEIERNSADHLLRSIPVHHSPRGTTDRRGWDRSKLRHPMH